MSRRQEKITNLTLASIFLTGYVTSKLTAPQSEITHLVRSYGADVCLPAMWTTGLALQDSLRHIDRSQANSGALAFLGCTAFEYAQKFGWYDGVFDPKDFAAYAIGAIAAMRLTNLTARLRKE